MKKKKFANSKNGGGLKNKAFTLIELLAIIVILAIIAVITVPIILNVIDNAKRGSIIDSAYGYKDAVDKYYFTKLMEEDFELDGLYTISDGKLMKDLSELDIPFNGTGPTSGIMKYTDGELTRACLTLDDYKVTYDGSKFISEKGTCLVTRQIVYTDETDEENKVGYYNTEWIGTNPIYYNPVTGESCTDYHEDNSKTGYNGVSPEDNQTSCLKWYAYSEQNEQVNLLLDHNTSATLAWVTKDDYDKPYDAEDGAQSLGITYPNGITGTDSYGSRGNWNKGPITLLKQLKTDTSSWAGLANRTDSYTASNNYNSETVVDRYTIDYSGYKARLVTSQEIAYITGNTSWDAKNKLSGSFYFDSKTSTESPTCKEGDTSGCSYGWLYDRIANSCEIYGCLNSSDVENSRYWTVSTVSSNFYHTLGVYRSGRIYPGYVDDILYFGTRPVITVSKSDLSLS